MRLFGFWKKKGKPTSTPASVTATPFADDASLWRFTSDIFAEHGHRLISLDDWLKHPDSGFMLRPKIVALAGSGNTFQSAVVMECMHPHLIPDGVFEYQHSMGESAEDAVRQGIDQWVQMDFVTLLDSLKDQPGECMLLEMNFEATESAPGRIRRLILGPVAHMLAGEQDNAVEDEHPFCACCLFTNSFEAFRPVIEDDGFYGIRLFASRSSDGSVDADCRINGNDYEPGAKALREYAKTWPPSELEFRKQYIVMQTVDVSISEDADEADE